MTIDLPVWLLVASGAATSIVGYPLVAGLVFTLVHRMRGEKSSCPHSRLTCPGPLCCCPYVGKGYLQCSLIGWLWPICLPIWIAWWIACIVGRFMGRIFRIAAGGRP